MRASRAASLVAALVLVMSCGCRTPATQIVVVVQSDLPPEDIAQVRVTAQGRMGRFVVATGPVAPGEVTLPFSFGVAQQGSETHTEITVEALDASDGVSVARALRVPFFRGELRRVVVSLSSACVSLAASCRAMSLECASGACVARDVPDDELVRVTAGAELEMLPPITLDGGVPGDAPPPDASSPCRGRCGAGTTCVTDRCLDIPTSCESTPTALDCQLASIPDLEELWNFNMGDDPLAEQTGGAPLVPQLRIGITPYAIGTTEVTVQRFRRFVDAGMPRPASVRYMTEGVPVQVSFDGVTLAMPGTTAGCNWSSTSGARDLHPINCVDWWTALAFCAWDGGRLPTEAEWEYAARSEWQIEPMRSAIFPWGDTPDFSTAEDCMLAQALGCAGQDGLGTRRVAQTRRWRGIYDLVGNVAEWSADRYAPFDTMTACWQGGDVPFDAFCWDAAPDPAVRTTRGGSWRIVAAARARLRPASRVSQPASTGLDTLGFRCAYPSAPPI